MAKDLPASAGDIRNVGLIPGLGRSLEEGMLTHSSILDGESQGGSSLVWDAAQRVAKSWTRLKRLGMHARQKWNRGFFRKASFIS